jgi:hypothetical protein
MASNQGEVDIVLGDVTYTLQSTLGAAKRVNAHFGSMGEAYFRVSKMELEAYTGVIAKALATEAKDLEALEQAVWSAGLDALRVPLTKYITLLTNGGREPAPPTAPPTAAPVGNV